MRGGTGVKSHGMYLEEERCVGCSGEKVVRWLG